MAKYRHFPYIKQNSIAEIVSTMESFWVAGRGLKPPDLRLRLFAARDLIVSDLTGFYLLHDMMSESARFR